ncbi:MAG TPA: TadE/TadG family type IV pilus assembly protein [Phenylobacterium sp.]|nr:TadE/TadG family type IV pilus assembly protein [Phenylobacterium sp.]
MLSRFTRDRRGAAAVEFALIAPIMLLLYYGLAELTQGLMADRRAAHVAATIGDLAAQDTQLNQTEIDDVFMVGQAIISPFPSAPLSMRITSVKADASGNPKVVWSKASGTMTALTGDVSGVPAGLIAANESVIMAEASYHYTSSIKKVIPNGLNFSQKYYLKPRKGSEVLWSAS